MIHGRQSLSQTTMSLGISARLKYPKKHELVKSHSQSQILANKLRQDGVMGTVENVMQAVDQVAALLVSKHIDPNIPYKDSIINLCQHLKVYGAYLELLFEDQLNRAFIVFRNSSQDDERLDYLSRLHLLELIELRAKGWKGTDVMNQYYRKKANQCVQKIEASESASSLTESMTSVTTAPPLLAPGEIIKPSGKFSKPTRIPGKNYCKDEVVIRNADSGKVMGIKGRRVHMIEELSETIISFQRVNPGAKERLVQITGANEESINHAKQLIEDTIRRNASPVREHGIAVGGPLTGSSSSINSSASEDSALPHSARASRTLIHSLSTNDATIGEFKYTVVVGGCTIKITGDNLDLVRTSKLVLDEYFSGEPLQDVGQFYSFDSLPQPIVAHDLAGSPLSPPESLPSPGLANGQADDSGPAPLRRPHLAIEDIMKGKTSPDPTTEKMVNHTYSIEYLARLAMSPLCLVHPDDWERISTDYPNLVRKEVEFFDAKQYLSDRSGDQCQTILSADEVESEEGIYSELENDTVFQQVYRKFRCVLIPFMEMVDTGYTENTTYSRHINEFQIVAEAFEIFVQYVYAEKYRKTLYSSEVLLSTCMPFNTSECKYKADTKLDDFPDLPNNIPQVVCSVVTEANGSSICKILDLWGFCSSNCMHNLFYLKKNLRPDISYYPAKPNIRCIPTP